jgi:hypothetical protein
MKLQELSDAWNSLRNDVFGRGVVPTTAVPKPLADRFANTYDRWRAWLGNAGVIDDVLADATAASWVSDYRALAADLAAAGVKITAPLPTTFGENVSSAAASAAVAAGKLGATIAIVIAAVSLPMLYLMVGGRRR